MAKNLIPSIFTEIAKDATRPVELYEIFTTIPLYYAAYNADIPFFTEAGIPQVYTGFNITRSAVRTNVSSRCDEVTVTLANVDLTMGAVAAYGNIIGKRVRIIQIFLDEDGLPPTDPLAFNPIFDGIIDDPQINEYALSVRLVYALDFLGLTLPRRRYQRNCNWKFGSPECGKSLGTVTGTITNISGDGLTLTLSGRMEAMNYFKDGALSIGEERRRILNSNAESFVIDYPFNFAQVGNSYLARRGCDKTWNTCKNRYNNTINYGGFLSVPTERKLLRL